MFETLHKEWEAKVSLVFVMVVTLWWIWLFASGVKESSQNYYFGATYGLICLFGGIIGLTISAKWGGLSSIIGRAIICLSLGLLTQEFGQLIFSYYNIFLHVEIPYPSLADVGFFGTIPFYIYGISLLAKAAGSKFSLKIVTNQIQVIILPIILLTVSYLVFLRNYEFDWTNPVRIFLDFGYPLGEALYISIAILTYSLSRNLLGGIMKGRILFLVFAFVLQYLAEFNFLYQNSNGTWVNGGYGDYLYFVAYTTMVFGLIRLKSVFHKME